LRRARVAQPGQRVALEQEERHALGGEAAGELAGEALEREEAEERAVVAPLDGRGQRRREVRRGRAAAQEREEAGDRRVRAALGGRGHEPGGVWPQRCEAEGGANQPQLGRGRDVAPAGEVVGGRHIPPG
jgi:hypothetical protein